jgi:hypothetical protein
MKEELSDEERQEAEAFLARAAQRAEILAGLETRLGVPKGFVVGLHDEKDDWTFVVKMAVFVEAAVTRVLVQHLGNDLMYDHLAGITNGRRLELSRVLGLLEPYEVGALNALATVRNAFAHNVANLNGSLATYVDSLTGDQKANLILRLVPFEPKDRPKAADDLDWMRTGLRAVLHAAVVPTLISLAARGDEAQRARDQKEWQLANQGKGWTLPDLFRHNGKAASALLTATTEELETMIKGKAS